MTTTTTSEQPLTVLRSEFWQDLEGRVRSQELPAALADLLKALISSYMHHAIPPSANPHLVRLAAQYLPNGIQLLSGSEEPSRKDELLDIIVFTPEAGRDDLRSFFQLIRKYPGGKFMYPSDIA